MLCDELSNHFEVAEFLDRNVLQHIADAGILNMEGLDPVLESCGEFASCSPELFEQECTKACIWFANIYRLDEFFAMQKHTIALYFRGYRDDINRHETGCRAPGSTVPASDRGAEC
jgi:hypothetical protein